MNYLEISGFVYIISMSWAFMCDLYTFVSEQEKKKQWREYQKIK